jgi:hypothetical protein
VQERVKAIAFGGETKVTTVMYKCGIATIDQSTDQDVSDVR